MVQFGSAAVVFVLLCVFERRNSLNEAIERSGLTGDFAPGRANYKGSYSGGELLFFLGGGGESPGTLAIAG